MIPSDAAALDRYMTAVRPRLRRTPAAAEVLAWLLDLPGMEEEIARLWQDITGAAGAALPDWARDMYGCPAPSAITPARRAEIRQALGMLDAAILGEPGVLQARQRLALRVRSTTRMTPPGRAVSAALGGASAAARAVLRSGTAKLRAERGCGSSGIRARCRPAGWRACGERRCARVPWRAAGHRRRGRRGTRSATRTPRP